MDYNSLRQIFKYCIGKDINNKQDRETVATTVLHHDLMWRTEGGVANFRKNYKGQYYKEYDDQIIKDIADIVYKYLVGPCPKTQADFDKWHNNACLYFLNKYNSIFASHGANGPKGIIQISYGKAQKGINMMLKNFSMMDNANSYIGNCKYAHMPIDADVKKWFVRNGNNIGNTAWSKLDYAEYINSQSIIRAYVSLNSQIISSDFASRFPKVSLAGFSSPLTVYEAEFLIWAR